MEKTTTQQKKNNTTTTIQLYYTYILQLNNNSYYTGITNNIGTRLMQHIAGQSKSTKWHLPVRLVYKTTHTTRQAARRLEVKIKNMGAAKYLSKLKYTSTLLHDNENTKMA